MAGKARMRPSFKKHTRRYKEVIAPAKMLEGLKNLYQEAPLRQPPRLAPKLFLLEKTSPSVFVFGSALLQSQRTIQGL